MGRLAVHPPSTLSVQRDRQGAWPSWKSPASRRKTEHDAVDGLDHPGVRPAVAQRACKGRDWHDLPFVHPASHPDEAAHAPTGYPLAARRAPRRLPTTRWLEYRTGSSLMSMAWSLARCSYPKQECQSRVIVTLHPTGSPPLYQCMVVASVDEGPCK